MYCRIRTKLENNTQPSPTFQVWTVTYSSSPNGDELSPLVCCKWWAVVKAVVVVVFMFKRSSYLTKNQDDLKYVANMNFVSKVLQESRHDHHTPKSYTPSHILLLHFTSSPYRIGSCVCFLLLLLWTHRVVSPSKGAAIDDNASPSLLACAPSVCAFDRRWFRFASL